MARPGELDTQIIIQRVTLTPDGIGGNSEDWNTFDTVFAKIVGNTGRESEQGEQVEADAVYTFTIRNRADLLMTDRILFNSQFYNIRFIPDIGVRPLYLDIKAERGVAQ